MAKLVEKMVFGVHRYDNVRPRAAALITVPIQNHEVGLIDFTLELTNEIELNILTKRCVK